jgi:hypothetical protein
MRVAKMKYVKYACKTSITSEWSPELGLGGLSRPLTIMDRRQAQECRNGQ